MDISAFIGVTGALFQKVFGSVTGSLLSGFILILWIIGPAWLASRIFAK